MSEPFFIGIGNPFRSDDRAGWAAIDLLEKRGVSPSRLHRMQGDLAELLDLFSKHSILYVIDACLSKDPSKPWRRFDLHGSLSFSEERPSSTHGFTLKQGVELAQQLGSLPAHAILFAIEGENFSPGEEFSPRVAQSISEVVDVIINKEMPQCTKSV